MKISEEFRLFNENDGEFKVKITELNKRDLQVIVLDKLREVAPLRPLILAICIIKPDRLIEAIKGATQLGVTEILPIISDRTQYKNINRERIIKCIIEATEQSERLSPPALHAPLKIAELNNISDVEQIIFANEEETLENKISSIKPLQDKIVVLIGPEGGFTAKEKTELMANPKVSSISLGNTVLRSEVATVSLLACISQYRS